MSLADELMNDLDGLSDDGGPSDTEQPVAGPSSAANGDMGPPALPSGVKGVQDDEDDDMKPAEEEEKLESGESAAGYVPAGGTRPAEELDRDEVEHMNLKTIENVESVVKLHKSKRLHEALTVSIKCILSLARTEADVTAVQKIEFYSNTDKPIDNSIESGPIEENPEYALIVQANNLSVEVDNELLLVHKASKARSPSFAPPTNGCLLGSVHSRPLLGAVPGARADHRGSLGLYQRREIDRQCGGSYQTKDAFGRPTWTGCQHDCFDLSRENAIIRGVASHRKGV